MSETSKQPTVFDSDQQQLGDVYAKALLGVGQKAGKVDELVGELAAVTEVVEQLPRLAAALSSPRITNAAKVSLLEKSFSGKVSNDMLNFLKLIGSKGRFDCLGAMSASAERLNDEMSGRLRGTLTTAEAVEDQVRERVEQQISGKLGKTVRLESVIDPEIVGGMVIRVGDTVYDGSVSNQLAQVRTKAVKRASDLIREKLEQFTSG